MEPVIGKHRRSVSAGIGQIGVSPPWHVHPFSDAALQQTSGSVFQVRIGNFFPIIGKCPKIFSNHWKNREKFFQSLEKSAQIFQPLEKKFPIIGKIRAGRPPRPSGDSAAVSA
ncbi:MAG: hypothetical protein IKQ55_07390 [Kiritimatiellae bacterium]|nr:hypothetical protein [Kiritimatiellia bacterium]